MSLEGLGSVSAPLARPNRRGMTPGSNPYLFVVGAARSGTTLLQRMLDAHPLLAVVNETYWLPRKYWQRAGLTRDGLVTPALFPLLLDSPKFERMGFGKTDLRRIAGDGAPIRYVDFVGRLFDEYATRQGKKLAGDKTPGYVRRMARLHELWPEAKWVHIIRDPRDVCLSMLDWSSGERTAGQFGTWQLDRAVSSALYWRYSVAMGREAGVALGADVYFETRYEDLVTTTEAELGRLCEFLGIPFDAAMQNYHVGRTRPKPGRSSKAQWLPPTRGLRDWRTQLAAHDSAAIEVAVGELLGELGYPSGGSPARPALLAHVDEVRSVFTAHLRADDRPIPRSW
jgi:sulfotransferase family protein